MRDRARRATAVGATAVVLAGSALLGMPGTAAADTVTAKCGETVTVKPGDTISTPFGLKTVTDGLTSLVGGLLGGLCKVTVNIVDAVVAPVPVVGAPIAGAVDGTVAGTTNGVTKVTGDVGRSLSGGGQPAPQQPGTGGNPQNPPPGGTGGAPQGTTPIPEANSPLLPGFSSSPVFGGFPFSTGYAPMRDYGGIPFATAGLFTPSPAIRYGSQIPGYAPQYGLTGPDQNAAAGNSGIQTAGRAEALPSASGGFTDGSNLPLLIAVLALSGVSAGLVRTWVLRRMAAAN